MEKIAQECMGYPSAGGRLVSFFKKNVNCTMREQNITEITLEEIRLRWQKTSKHKLRNSQECPITKIGTQIPHTKNTMYSRKIT